MKPILTLAALLLLAFASGCDLLSPKKDTNISFQDTTVTVPNGSILLYGTVTQAPLDSATLARLRKGGYTGGADKAPVANADVFAINGDTIKTVTDSRGRFALALKSGRFTVHIGNYATSSLDTTLTIDANKELNVILTPLKEFIFPLAIGDVWIYDYSYSGRWGDVQSGPDVKAAVIEATQKWEIIDEIAIPEGKQYSIKAITTGKITISPAFPTPQPQNYYNETTTTINLSSSQINTPYGTIPRFSLSYTGKDTVTLQGRPGSIYISKVGLISYGSSGQLYRTTLILKSYTLKP